VASPPACLRSHSFRGVSPMHKFIPVAACATFLFGQVALAEEPASEDKTDDHGLFPIWGDKARDRENERDDRERNEENSEYRDGKRNDE